jgi:probable HAF family extracellular repeat protein
MSATQEDGMTKSWKLAIACVLATTLGLPALLNAQDAPSHKPKHHQYRLIDMGTFGGPNSSILVNTPNLNSNGTSVGSADTTTTDPYSPMCFASLLDLNLSNNTGLGPDCQVTHASQARNGVVTDLGALPGGDSSLATAVSNSGVVAGISENGSIDQLTGFPQIRAVAWNRGSISNLGTFGGNVSASFAVNSRGDVVGAASNSIPDSFASWLGPCFYPGFRCWPVATQLRAFVSRSGAMKDIGTLGGTDAYAAFVNESGDVVGASFTSMTPNPTTGVPTVDSFIWKNGKMTDLGSFGGTITFPYGLNNRGQVVGSSNLAGDQTNSPFLWDRGTMKNLGTLGGDFGQAFWINDAGDAVGYATYPGNATYGAVLWSKGTKTDLGYIGSPCSGAFAVNSSQQVVGATRTNPCANGSIAFLWENGGPMVDLNALLKEAYDGHLYWSININEQGEIAALGQIPGGGIHAYLLVPDGDCDGDCEQRIANSASRVTSQVQPTGAQVNLMISPKMGARFSPFANRLELGRPVK